ncbi:MAG: hypothetical protein ABI650_02865, partial [Dokdonella sp.]
MPNTLRDTACLCVYGEAACSVTWLESARAQWADPPMLVLLGASAGVATELPAVRLPDLDVSDPRSALEAIAAHVDGSVVILRSDAVVPPYTAARLLRALALPDVLAAGALDNLDVERAPLPVGTCSDEASTRIDALCHAFASQRVIDSVAVSPLAS